jgi:CBS domain-containing protein
MHGYVNTLLANRDRPLYTTSARVSVRNAVGEMRRRGVDALLVLNDGRFEGVFTIDEVMAVIDSGRAPALTTVGEAMKRGYFSVGLTASVGEAISTMQLYGCRCLPVMDEGQIVGMLTSSDLIRFVGEQQEEQIARFTDYITGRAPA